jgi:hypothetical protein
LESAVLLPKTMTARAARTKNNMRRREREGFAGGGQSMVSGNS